MRIKQFQRSNRISFVKLNLKILVDSHSFMF